MPSGPLARTATGVKDRGVTCSNAIRNSIAVTGKVAGSASTQRQAPFPGGAIMVNNIKIEITLRELLLVTTLLSDQLFPRSSSIRKCPVIKETPRSLQWGKSSCAA